MTTVIVPYALAGMALALLVGGVLILGHAFKTWVEERHREKN
jgi:hypothetical protein